jgi:hypothetical protein
MHYTDKLPSKSYTRSFINEYKTIEEIEEVNVFSLIFYGALQFSDLY